MNYIYKITNNITGKSYIGFTSKNPKERFKTHCNAAKSGSETHFHRAIRKYGEDVWSISILETSSDKNFLLEKREDYHIKSHTNLYNMAPGGKGGDLSQFIDYKNLPKNKGGYKIVGRRVSEEGRKKISEAAKKRKTKSSDYFTEESIAKMRDANLGKPKSEEAKRKMSEAAKNRQKFQCEHCGGYYWKTHLVRYHGDKCKMKKN